MLEGLHRLKVQLPRGVWPPLSNREWLELKAAQALCWREQGECLLPHNNCVEILIVVLVEGGKPGRAANPKVDCLWLHPKRLGRPRDAGLHIFQERRKVLCQVAVLLLQVDYEVALLS